MPQRVLLTGKEPVGEADRKFVAHVLWDNVPRVLIILDEEIEEEDDTITTTEELIEYFKRLPYSLEELSNFFDPYLHQAFQMTSEERLEVLREFAAGLSAVFSPVFFKWKDEERGVKAFMAELLEVDPSLVTRWLSGERVVPDLYIALLQFWREDLEWLVDQAEEMKEESQLLLRRSLLSKLRTSEENHQAPNTRKD
jgi:hypothetical protein